MSREHFKTLPYPFLLLSFSHSSLSHNNSLKVVLCMGTMHHKQSSLKPIRSCLATSYYPVQAGVLVYDLVLVFFVPFLLFCLVLFCFYHFFITIFYYSHFLDRGSLRFCKCLKKSQSIKCFSHFGNVGGVFYMEINPIHIFIYISIFL